LGCTHTDMIQDQDFEEFRQEYGVDLSPALRSNNNVGSRDPDGFHLIDYIV